MPLSKGSRAKSTKKKKMEADSGSLATVAPSEPSHQGKQTVENTGRVRNELSAVKDNKNREKLKRKAEKASPKVVEHERKIRRNSGRKQTTENVVGEMESTEVAFDHEGDEVMAIKVSEQADRIDFPMEGEEEMVDYNYNSSTEQGECSSDDEVDSEEGDDEPPELMEMVSGDEGEIMEEDEEVSFPNSQNNNASIKELNNEEEGEECAPAELKTMMRFANFLEKKGYLKRGAIDEITQNNSNQTVRAEGKKIQKKTKQGETSGADYQRKSILKSPLPGNSNLVCDKNKQTQSIPMGSSNSEVTIYQNAVIMDLEENEKELKRISSSSDEFVNTSDEVEDDDLLRAEQNAFNSFVDARHKEYKAMAPQPLKKPEQAHTSKETVEERIDKVIRQAEAAKARMNLVAGKSISSNQEKNSVRGTLAHSLYVDEKYCMMGNHVDRILRAKIVANEFIDFAKLLPRDKLIEEDGLLLPVQRGGQMFLQNASDRSLEVINSFAKWEQAFRLFTHVYSEAYPKRSSELIQYNYVIHSASQRFSWENVYAYDRDFRKHISQFPERSWSVILQQVWTMRLHDRISYNGYNKFQRNNQQGNKKPNICRKFNNGKCTFGFNCKFEHKCGTCGKFGHGTHNCRKAVNNNNPSDMKVTVRDKESGEFYEKRFEDKSRKSGGGGGYKHK